MAEKVELHGLALSGADDSGSPEGRVRLPAALRPVLGAFDGLVAAVSGPDDVIREAGTGLPAGPAFDEAVAVRLRRRGVPLVWGSPITPTGDLLEAVRAHGRASVAVARADPSLLPELAVGSWFDASLCDRVRRTVLVRARRPATVDAAFWLGVREAATGTEWGRLARSSYVALVYHRLAGERKRGQERVDLDPKTFHRQLALLQALRFHQLRTDDVLAFHLGDGGALPRRSFVITVDDAVADCFEPLHEHAQAGPLLFVPTAETGGHAHWLDGERVLDWAELRRLANAGVAICSHAAHHRPLTGLAAPELRSELVSARSSLAEEIPSAPRLLAYPNGAHDESVIAAARDAGERAAFTTEKGRNGAGTHPLCLRRVSVHAADGPLAVLWKVVTGAAVPGPWARLRRLGRR